MVEILTRNETTTSAYFLFVIPDNNFTADGAILFDHIDNVA